MRGRNAVAEIGVFTPEPAKGTRHSELNPSMRGAYRVLAENHYQFDIVDAESDFSRYRMLIMPDTIRFDQALAQKVEKYLDGGGRLLLSSESGLWQDRDEFALTAVGAKMLGISEYENEYFQPAPGIISSHLPDARHVLYERGRNVQPAKETEILAELWQPYFNRNYRHFSSHFQTPPEKPTGYPEAILNGSVGYIAHPIFQMIRKHGARTYKELVLALVRRLLPDPCW